MEYTAIRKGFFQDSIVEEKETFEADDFKGSWAVPSKEFKPEPEPSQDDIQAKAKEAAHGKKVEEPADEKPKKKRGRPKKQEG